MSEEKAIEMLRALGHYDEWLLQKERWGISAATWLARIMRDSY